MMLSTATILSQLALLFQTCDLCGVDNLSGCRPLNAAAALQHGILFKHGEQWQCTSCRVMPSHVSQGLHGFYEGGPIYALR